jgi:GntR family transcriptional regulator
MFMKIETIDGVPIYLQIAREIKHSIAVGALRPGEQIPSVREIALHITVNPNTVAKAYRELEAQGIVETRRGTGTFVAKEGFALSQAEKRRTVGGLIDRVLDEARHLRLDEDEVKRLFNEKLGAFREEIERQGDRND